MSVFFGHGNTIQMLKLLFWFGFERSMLGAIIGAVWGFVRGYFDGALLAWLYKMIARTKPSTGV